MDRSIWLAHLEEWQREAEAALQAQLGIQTACELHRDGRVTGGLKYAEGRLVALNDLLRLVRRTSAAVAVLQGQAEQEPARWQRELAYYQAQPNASLPWLAYCQGGVDACGAALALLAMPQ